MLVGKTYDELDDSGQRGEWLMDHAKGRGYATAFIEGDAVGSRSSLAMVRLKSFGGSEADAVRGRDARRISHRFADHSLSAVFDQVLDTYSPPLKSFGDSTPALCFGSGGALFDQQADYMRDFWREYAGASNHPFPRHTTYSCKTADPWRSSAFQSKTLSIPPAPYSHVPVVIGGWRLVLLALIAKHPRGTPDRRPQIRLLFADGRARGEPPAHQDH